MELTVFSIAGLLLCLGSVFAGLLDAVAGGGGLVTLPIFLAVGFPVHSITGTSQASTLPGGVITVVKFALEGKVHWGCAIPTMLFALAGAAVGARLNIFLPEDVLKSVMVVLIPIVAVATLLKHDFGIVDRSDELSRTRLLATSAAIGLVLGAYQGFYGAGSGTFFLVALAVFDRLDLVRASGTCKPILVGASVSATVTYVAQGLVRWDFVLALMLFNSLGSYIGAHIALKRGARVIRPVFYGVLVLLFVKLILDLLGVTA